MKSYGLRAYIIFFIDFCRSWWDFMRGMRALSHIKEPKITIFGGMHTTQEGFYAQKAREFALLCAQNKVSIITGGGSGIMEAANCGAYGQTLGIRVQGVEDTFVNPCAPVITVRHFFVRKWLLTLHSSGVVMFPGGIGTADEFFDLMNHLKLNRHDKLIIVLFGKEYWHHLVEWVTQTAMKQGFILPALNDFFLVTDDVHEAFRVIMENKDTVK